MKLAAELGSISSGTMLASDLIPTFTAELEALDTDGLFADVIKSANSFIEADDMDGEEADWMLEDLFNALEEFAPEGAYFGKHPGDGADYGFWLVED